MLARHGESLFWAGRYLERAEDTGRMLEVTFRSTVTSGPADAEHRWTNLLSALRLHEVFESTGHTRTDGRAVAEFLVADRDNPGSVVSTVERLRENLRSLRELIPSELFEQTNRFHLELARRDLAGAMANDPFELLSAVRLRCQTLAGIAGETMSRDEGFRFLTLGQALERALMTSRSLRVGYLPMRSSLDEVVLTLRAVSGLEPFRREAHTEIDADRVARFLLLSTTFPRSVLFCLLRAEAQLSEIPPADASTRPARLLGQLRSRLEYAETDELTGDIPGALDEIEDRIRAIAEAVGRQYFRAAEELDLHAQHLVPGQDEPAQVTR